jgi:hypothetical protein
MGRRHGLALQVRENRDLPTALHPISADYKDMICLQPRGDRPAHSLAPQTATAVPLPVARSSRHAIECFPFAKDRSSSISVPALRNELFPQFISANGVLTRVLENVLIRIVNVSLRMRLVVFLEFGVFVSLP